MTKIKSKLQPRTTLQEVELGAALQYYRLQRQMTFTSLQLHSKVSDTLLKDMECGRKVNPTFNILLQITAALNVSIADFIATAILLVSEEEQQKHGVLKNGSYSITSKGIKNTNDFIEYQRYKLGMDHKTYAKYVDVSVGTLRSLRFQGNSLSLAVLSRLATKHKVTMPQILNFKKEEK